EQLGKLIIFRNERTYIPHFNLWDERETIKQTFSVKCNQTVLKQYFCDTCHVGID
ncbi:hypothetical protein L9F63_014889, partial [Diploptera punctata]